MASIQTSIRMSDYVSSSLHNITNALNLTLTAFQGVQDTASRDIDANSFGAIRQQINAATIATQQFESELSRLQPRAVPITPEWNIQSNLDVFQNTGVDRLNLEMGSLNDITNDVLRSQQRIGEQSLNMDLLPPNASWDINATNQRIAELGQRITALQNIDISTMDDASVSRMNSEVESLRASMNSVVNLQAEMNNAIEQGDMTRLNAGFSQLNNVAEQVERRVRADVTAIQELTNIQWQTPQNIEIFNTNEVQRYEQEIQSANTMLTRLTTTQQAIGQRAATMRILPPQAVTDIQGMGSRIQALQAQIQRVQNARIQVVGVERANAEMEQLRQQLNTALQVQEDMNAAMNRMDVSAANAAYERLNGIVNQTERNIRDNINEQENFNSSVRNGQNATNGLQSSIMRMAAAYLSIQGAGKALNLSDTMASNAARLDLIVDDGGTVEDLQNRIFLSAQRARSDYLAVSQTVSKLGLLAGDSFSGNDEMIAFAEQMNKNFVIGGASIQEQTSAMYQLTQAMAAGKLQGDEYRSIIENAPLLANAIEDYMTNAGVEGTMKDWASEGLLTAEVIKAAMFSVSDETNARFEKMPQTFAQVAVGIQNNAVMAFQPILTRLNEIANSEAFATFANGAISALVTVAGIVMWIFDLVGAVGGFVVDNWSLIAPIVYGVAAALAIYAVYLGITNGLELISKGLKIAMAIASYAKAAATGTEASATATATAAQYGLNTALLACPLTWIIIAIIAIIAVIYLVVAAVNKFAGTSVSATGIIFGAFAVLGAFLWNLFLGLLELVFGVINAMVNPFIRIANFIGNVFTSPVSSIIYLFQSMADGVLAILQKIASALDFVFGSNMADTVAGWRSGLKEMADAAVAEYAPNENYQKVMDELDLSVESVGLKRWEYGDAWDTGYTAGENLESEMANFDPASLFENNIPNADDYATPTGGGAYEYDPSNMAADVAGINSNTSDMASTSEEDLKYLRDIAERETINRYFNIDMGGITTNNNVKSDMDLDGIAEKIYDTFGDMMMERIDVSAEGVYV